MYLCYLSWPGSTATRGELVIAVAVCGAEGFRAVRVNVCVYDWAGYYKYGDVTGGGAGILREWNS